MFNVDAKKWLVLYHATDSENLPSFWREGIRHQRSDVHMTLLDPSCNSEECDDWCGDGVAAAAYIFKLEKKDMILIVNNQIAELHHVRTVQSWSNSVLAQ